MNLGNITSKITSKADTIGKLYGYFGLMTGRASATGQDPLAFIIATHEQALNAVLQGKLPKLDNIIAMMRAPVATGMIKNAFIVYILGEVGGGFIGSKNANALKKFAVETIKFTALSSAVQATTWNPHPPSDIAAVGNQKFSGAISTYTY